MTSRSSWRTVTFAAVIAAGGCTGEETGFQPVTGMPTSMEIASTAMQDSSAAGEVVPVLPSVLVRDQNGQPMAGARVEFRMDAGNGTLTGNVVKSNAQGIATVGAWALGTQAYVVNRLSARVIFGTTASTSIEPVSFQVVSRPGAPATIVRTAGNDQTTNAGSAVPIAPMVTLADRFGNLVPNATVVFTPTAGGGSVSGNPATSDPQGRAAVGAWIVGIGINTLSATVGSLPAVSFTGTGVVAGKVVGTVSDATSLLPVAGITVTATSGGTTRTATTNAQGMYEVVLLPAGTYSVSAGGTGYVTNTAENIGVVADANGTGALVDFALPPTGASQQFGAFTGKVLAQNGTALANASVTLSGGTQTNGVFRSTITDAYGNYAFSGINLNDVNGDPITTFTARGVASGYAVGSRTVTLVQNQVVTGQDIVLGPPTASTVYFADGFESDSPWTRTGMWHRYTPTNIVNRGVTLQYVRLAPNDTSAGRLPRAAGGDFAWWYGQDSTGNFIGQRTSGDGQYSGGTSTAANEGDLRSPAITVPVDAPNVSLRFDTYFEIESVNPNSGGFDLLEVILVDEATGTETSLGRLNPFEDPPLPNRAAIPFSSAGFNRAPLWRPVFIDAALMRGRTMRIIFRFDTVDGLYNGFRGWLVDNVTVTDESANLTDGGGAASDLAPLTLRKVDPTKKSVRGPQP